MAQSNRILKLFLENISSEYPEHMFCYFANAAAKGILLPFTKSLLNALDAVECASPGYSDEMLKKMGHISKTGEDQYEALLQILAEIYVTSGLVVKADQKNGRPLFVHEPGPKSKKNPEFEICLSGHWCAIEVKAPRLIQYGRLRSEKPWQICARLPHDIGVKSNATLPRDNPVKDFLISAEEKFAVYETHRKNALRILIIIWDDFCNEPISALTNTASGLLTDNTFYRNEDNTPVTYPHLDGIIIVRHQHQIIRSTRCEPLIDGITGPFCYHHDGFPSKAFIEIKGGRNVPAPVLEAMNAIPLSNCVGAEYNPTELIMWNGFEG